MAALLWLLIPVAAGVVASVWGGLAARRRTIVPDADGVAGYERFREAMERSAGPAWDSALAPDASPDRVPAAVVPVRGAPDGPAREAR
ncbi:hypothetical protein DVA86_01585 [Streptomyces armeniacus]|uniref:Sensor histidine kinase n=1 Tax=Streptomyces armeniacus TaxID=83291 RepID=A0A345XIR4_9ACTN|nr:hypothetical protein [Streptomyces armeniacus]AXK31530.1 hypothetical protein DVA86_01585 [Streptomyces armeniacus]